MIGVLLVVALSSNANLPQSWFFGTDAGLDFKGDAVSHVFVGPYAGRIWRGDEKLCPLFSLTNSHGDEILTIDRRGRVHRRVSYKKLREAFENYRMFRKAGDP